MLNGWIVERFQPDPTGAEGKVKNPRESSTYMLQSWTEGADIITAGPDLLSQDVRGISAWKGIPRWWVGSRLAAHPSRPSTWQLRLPYCAPSRAHAEALLKHLVEAMNESKQLSVKGAWDADGRSAFAGKVLLGRSEPA